MARPLYFEIHIRPMFREIDQLHMKALFNIDLWSYDSVKSNLDLIDGALKSPPAPNDANAVMPPSSCGGPWPDAWLAVWSEWKTDPKSLPLGAATYEVTGSGDVRTLKAKGSPSQPNAAVWLEALPTREIPPRFVLHEEPPRAGIKGSPASFTILEKFPRGSATEIVVTDRNGTHKVPIP